MRFFFLSLLFLSYFISVNGMSMCAPLSLFLTVCVNLSLLLFFRSFHLKFILHFLSTQKMWLRVCDNKSKGITFTDSFMCWCPHVCVHCVYCVWSKDFVRWLNISVRHSSCFIYAIFVQRSRFIKIDMKQLLCTFESVSSLLLWKYAKISVETDNVRI